MKTTLSLFILSFIATNSLSAQNFEVSFEVTGKTQRAYDVRNFEACHNGSADVLGNPRIPLADLIEEAEEKASLIAQRRCGPDRFAERVHDWTHLSSTEYVQPRFMPCTDKAEAQSTFQCRSSTINP